MTLILLEVEIRLQHGIAICYLKFCMDSNTIQKGIWRSTRWS